MKRSIEQSQEHLADELMRREGISGVGIGAYRGKPCLQVYVSKPGPDKGIPNRFEGHRVIVVGAGPFEALDAPDGDGP